LVPGTNGISRQAKQIADPQGMGPEQISLQGNLIAIAARHLKHRLNPLLQQQAADGHAAHPHHSPAAIGDIDGMDQFLRAAAA
jgi:hypothetical protein